MSDESNSIDAGVAEAAPQGTILEAAQASASAPTEQPSTGVQTGEPVDSAAEGKTEEAEVHEGAPEAYEDFKAPEGIELNTGVLDEFKGLAKDLGLSQEKAQSVVDRMAPIMAERQAAYIREVAQGWAERSRKDAEVGGAHFEESLAAAARLRDRFAYGTDGKMDADIAEFLSSPMGNHPGALKLLARAGKAIGEAGFPQGGPEPRVPTADDFFASARRKNHS